MEKYISNDCNFDYVSKDHNHNTFTNIISESIRNAKKAGLEVEYSKRYKCLLVDGPYLISYFFLDEESFMIGYEPIVNRGELND
jgi:hypothetical protein